MAKKTDVLQQLEEQLRQKEEDHRRALADYSNLLRRTDEERSKLLRYSSASVLGQLLEPFDHLELAALHLKDKGLDMVVQQFKQVFENEGITEIQALGKLFNAETMEAVDVAEGEKDIVLEVRRKGYMLNGMVLRHAQVIVGKI